MLAIGADELGEKLGSTTKCPNCGEEHEVIYGEEILKDGTRVPSKMIAAVECDKNGGLYLVGLNERKIK